MVAIAGFPLELSDKVATGKMISNQPDHQYHFENKPLGVPVKVPGIGGQPEAKDDAGDGKDGHEAIQLALHQLQVGPGRLILRHGVIHKQAR